LIIANHIVEHHDLDEVWFVVTPHNPHKRKATLLNDTQRLMMLNLHCSMLPKIGGLGESDLIINRPLG